MSALPPDRDQLIVFARAPQLGKVKTRLAADLGEVLALQAYRELLGHCLREAAACPGVQRWLQTTGDDPHDQLQTLATGHGLHLTAQCEGDLGVRMAHALRLALSRGPRAVLIGCDCPPIDAGLLLQAFEMLHTHDFVIGPTEDGGYALVGARIDLPQAFAGIEWGEAGVMSQTRARLRQAGVSLHELPMLWDVDVKADWDRYLAWRAARKGLDASSSS